MVYLKFLSVKVKIKQAKVRKKNILDRNIYIARILT